MKSPVTLESLLVRVKKEVANKEKVSAQKKLEARAERIKRAEPQSMYEREELWIPVALHREYEVQYCDSCKVETTAFSCERVELKHKIDRSARRWLRERGEGMQQLPMHTTIVERVVPECFCCYSLGKFSTSLWKGKVHEKKVEVPAGNQPSAHPGDEAQGPVGESQGPGAQVPAIEQRAQLPAPSGA